MSWPSGSLGFCFLSEGICSPVFLRYCPQLADMGASAVSISRQVKQMWCVHTVEYYSAPKGKTCHK